MRLATVEAFSAEVSSCTDADPIYYGLHLHFQPSRIVLSVLNPIKQTS